MAVTEPRTSPPYLLLKVRQEDGACATCGGQIQGGQLYVVGPPPRHVACPSEKRRRWSK